MQVTRCLCSFNGELRVITAEIVRVGPYGKLLSWNGLRFEGSGVGWIVGIIKI